MDEPAIKIVPKGFVDETVLSRRENVDDRADILFAYHVKIRIVGCLSRAESPRGVDRENASFTDRIDRAVTCDDPFDKRGTSSRQPTDEYRLSGNSMTGDARQPPFVMGFYDPVDLRDLRAHIIVYVLSPHIRACFNMSEGSMVFINILTLLAQGVAKNDLGLPIQAPFFDKPLHLRNMIAIRALDTQVGTNVIGKRISWIESDGIDNKDRNFTRGSLEKFIAAADERLDDYLRRLDAGDIEEAARAQRAPGTECNVRAGRVLERPPATV